MADKRIPELDPKNVITGDMMFIMYDQVTDTSYRVNLNQIISGSSDITPWMPSPAVYNIGDLVLSDDKIWESNINGNIDVPPYEGVEWKEVSKSFVPSGDLTIDLAAHGFISGDWLTIKGGSWELCDEADVALGYVNDVIDANSFTFISKYQRASINGVTPFQYYYHENGGVTDGGPSDQLAYVAFTSGDVFLLTGVGGGGGGGAFWPLSGAATLTNDMSIDGAGKDISLGIVGGLVDQFDIYATRVRINGDPGYNSILGWDDTDNSIKHFLIGTGLVYNAGTDTLSIGSGGPYWPLSGFASITGPVSISGGSNNVNWSSQGAWSIIFSNTSGLSAFTPGNAGMNINDFGLVLQNAVDQTLMVQNFASNGNNANITDHSILRKRNTSIGGANGIGLRLLLQNSSTTGSTYRSNVIESVLTIANPATSRGELRFGVAENTAFAMKLVIDEFGAKYLANYSANYTSRSLTDKQYVDTAVGAIAQDNVTLSIYKMSNFGTP